MGQRIAYLLVDYASKNPSPLYKFMLLSDEKMLDEEREYDLDDLR